MSHVHAHDEKLGGGRVEKRTAGDFRGEGGLRRAARHSFFFACIFAVFFIIAARVEAASRVAATRRHLLSIHISTVGGATRCVLETDGPAKFSSHCLSNPARIYIDLKGFVFQKDVFAEALPVGLIEKVRAAQFDPGTMRIVFMFRRLPDLAISRISRSSGAGSSGLVLNFSSGAPSGADGGLGIKGGKSGNTLAAIKAEALNFGSGNHGVPSGKTAGLDRTGRQAVSNTPEAGLDGQEGFLPLHRWRVMIDAGHGGKDPGTSGEDGCHEKQYTLEIANRLAGILRQNPRYRVFLTRDADYFVTLDNRTLMANRDRADIFVSIHINWSSDPDTRGITTYFLNWTNDKEANRVAARENQISMRRMKAARTQLGSILASLQLDSKRNQSLELANYVEEKVTGLVRRAHPGEETLGVKGAIFYVLIGDKMPAILVEVSFLSNPRDERLLQEPSYIDTVAKGIAAGIEDYFRHRTPILPARTYASR